MKHSQAEMKQHRKQGEKKMSALNVHEGRAARTMNGEMDASMPMPSKMDASMPMKMHKKMDEAMPMKMGKGMGH